MSTEAKLTSTLDDVRRGGAPKYHEANAAKGKLFARRRIELLLDPDSFVEDAALANCQAGDLPADGVITGVGRIEGRKVAVMANDSTVKAGSWGRRTVEKILRIQETATRLRCPLVYLVDSAGARITDQIEMFPGRRGAGRIFFNQVQLSGQVPQVCLLFGPSAAGGAYIPAFCDIVVMVEGNASMYLGSPRMAEMVIGEKVTLEEMGGARMHCTTSGCGDFLVKTEEDALALGRRYLSYLPGAWDAPPPDAPPTAPELHTAGIRDVVPVDENKSFDMMEVVRRIIDAGSWLEIKRLYAKEILTGFARIEGRVVGIVANQPKHLGGVLFVDSADKAARFIWLCDAYNVPLLYLADVPGFMIGTKVEKQGIIRAGAKMIAAVSEARVPKLSVIVRKAYGAGLYAMCGPAFEPDACIALPTASIAVMGPSAAVNAVYYNKIQEVAAGPERDAYVAKLRDEYREDIDLLKLASELVIDAVIPFDGLRGEVTRRLAACGHKRDASPPKRRLVPPM
ncbi:MAG: acyl-CoA carboxylase subunit beta [Deltaproteobacteria bacterium]|nr:acyl-CoA carboxylase subunit beta [Deltaproteobacteria bacterium]